MLRLHYNGKMIQQGKSWPLVDFSVDNFQDIKDRNELTEELITCDDNWNELLKGKDFGVYQVVIVRDHVVPDVHLLPLK